MATKIARWNLVEKKWMIEDSDHKTSAPKIYTDEKYRDFDRKKVYTFDGTEETLPKNYVEKIEIYRKDGTTSWQTDGKYNYHHLVNGILISCKKDDFQEDEDIHIKVGKSLYFIKNDEAFYTSKTLTEELIEKNAYFYKMNWSRNKRKYDKDLDFIRPMASDDESPTMTYNDIHIGAYVAWVGSKDHKGYFAGEARVIDIDHLNNKYQILMAGGSTKWIKSYWRQIELVYRFKKKLAKNKADFVHKKIDELIGNEDTMIVYKDNYKLNINGKSISYLEYKKLAKEKHKTKKTVLYKKLVSNIDIEAYKRSIDPINDSITYVRMKEYILERENERFYINQQEDICEKIVNEGWKL